MAARLSCEHTSPWRQKSNRFWHFKKLFRVCQWSRSSKWILISLRKELHQSYRDKVFCASSPSQTVKGLLESVLFVELISCPMANSFRPVPLIRRAFYSKNSKKNFKRVGSVKNSEINTTEWAETRKCYSQTRKQHESVQRELSIFHGQTTCNVRSPKVTFQSWTNVSIFDRLKLMNIFPNYGKQS